ncbi:hypothetical protein K3495_g819 [Podosphaera aphanis]|nr:hypothetical protein K3495_g819 [Podosphaera aphanis]
MCFNRGKPVWAVETWSPIYLTYRPEGVVTLDERYINEAGNVDIDLRVTGPKLQVVDAPTASGKIELLATSCAQNQGRSILLIFFRQSLAGNLAEHLSLNTYTSKDIWSDATAKKRLSMCVDSTVRLLLSDSDLMDARIVEVRETVRRILCQANTTILTQFELMESDVEFWADITGHGINNPLECRRWMVPSQDRCPSMRYSEDFVDTIRQLWKSSEDAYVLVHD